MSCCLHLGPRGVGRQTPDRSCQDASVWTGEEPDSDSLLLSCSEVVNGNRTAFPWCFSGRPFSCSMRSRTLALKAEFRRGFSLGYLPQGRSSVKSAGAT